MSHSSMPSSAQDRARSAKAWAGEGNTCPETASGQDLEAARMRAARSSEGMTAMIDSANLPLPTRAVSRGPASARAHRTGRRRAREGRVVQLLVYIHEDGVVFDLAR